MNPEDIPEPDQIEGAPHPRLTPQLFGQQDAEQSFLKAFNGGRLHHAWLISGPQGVGKATLAWKIARFLLSPPSDASDGLFGTEPEHPITLNTSTDHPVARRMAALGEPSLYLCRRPWDDKRERLKQDITVDEVRKLKSFFNLSAADGGRRVVIVDTADEMNNSAANALLKILEEPPKKATLLLISHQPLRLLPTIRSRCSQLKCQPLAQDAMAAALLAAGFEADEDTSALAVLAGGSVGQAVRLLSGEGLQLYATLIRLFSHQTGLERPAAIALAQSCTGAQGLPRYDILLFLLPIFLHRLSMTGISSTLTPEAAGGEAELLGRLSPSPSAARGWAELAQTLSERAAHGRAVNLDPASVILDMLLKIDQLAGSLKAA